MVSLLLLIVDLAVLVLAVANVHGPLRFALGMVIGIIVPGWSIIGLLSLNNGAVEISLTIGVSLAMLMIIAQLLVLIHAWHLVGLEEFVCIACAPSLAWQFRRGRAMGR